MIDPILVAIARATLAVLFAHAAFEKLRAREWFAGILRDYRLLPEAWVKPVAIVLPLMEIATALALAWAPTAGEGAIAVLVMLGLFSFAVGINLLRGRRDIDCGCWGAFGASDSGLSAWLIARNGLLALLALLPLLPTAERAVVWLDDVSIAAATVALLFLLGIANRLVAQMPRLAKLRSFHE